MTATAHHLPDQSGRTVLITGANSGLGLASAQAFLAAGAHVIAACRNTTKAEVLKPMAADDQLTIVELDLSSLTSVAEAAAHVQQKFGSLDVLLNNAGIMALPYATTDQGVELQWATNHLGHFALTCQLLPTLVTTPGSRVVSVSSMMHQIGQAHQRASAFPANYQRWRAYGDSKLANLFFAFELQRRLSLAGSTTISVAAHPGYANTNLQAGHAQATGSSLEAKATSLMNRVLGQSAAAGAMPQLYAATAADVAGGDFYGPAGLFGARGAPTRVKAKPLAYDTSAASAQWQLSVELTGVDWPTTSSP